MLKKQTSRRDEFVTEEAQACRQKDLDIETSLSKKPPFVEERA